MTSPWHVWRLRPGPRSQSRCPYVFWLSGCWSVFMLELIWPCMMFMFSFLMGSLASLCVTREFHFFLRDPHAAVLWFPCHIQTQLCFPFTSKGSISKSCKQQRLKLETLLNLLRSKCSKYHILEWKEWKWYRTVFCANLDSTIMYYPFTKLRP